MSQQGMKRRSGVSTFLCAGALALAALVIGLTLPTGRASAADDGFVVVVNAGNSVSQLRTQEVSNLFLKKSGSWKDGTKAMPVDLSAPAAVRESFCRTIHSRGTSAVKSYWQQMIFSGREVPPLEKTSVSEVLSFVRANRGAIGYVPAGTPFGAGVKAIEVTP